MRAYLRPSPKGLKTSMIILTLLLLAPGACHSMPKGNAVDGRRWYGLNRCSGCHGDNGRGGRGPEIAGTGLSFHRFLGKIRAPNSEIMPSYPADRLSEQDAADIYAWLHMTEDR